MGKTTKLTPVAARKKTPVTSDRSARPSRSSRVAAQSPPRSAPSSSAWVSNLFVAAILAIALGVSGYFLRQYVDQRIAFPAAPPKVVLVNRPVWMSDYLAGQIMRAARPIGAHSSFDHQLLIDTVALLRSNPWVKQVNSVRRAYGQSPGDTLELDCDFRAPVAIVAWEDAWWLVDGDGAKLPEKYTQDELHSILYGSDGKLNIRIIQGIAHRPPEAGRKWVGDDLAAGLEVARLLAGRSYTAEIRAIDVANFNGRNDPREAELVLLTQYGTQIRWGRAPSEKGAFIEVSPAQKLQTLQATYESRHRVDAGLAWIDIRFDQIRCPTTGTADPATAQSSASTGN